MDLTINTSSVQIKLANANAAEKTQEIEKTILNENTESDEKTSVHTRSFDTVELSAEAVHYLNTGDSETTSEVSQNADTEASDSASAVTSSSDSDDDSTDALYTYTDDELADLLRNGTITQAEYNNEMAKRSSE